MFEVFCEYLEMTDSEVLRQCIENRDYWKKLLAEQKVGASLCVGRAF